MVINQFSDPPACIRIVGTKPGNRTGETIYITEDGRTWTNDYTPHNPQTTGPDTRSYVRVNNGYMCPSRHDH